MFKRLHAVVTSLGSAFTFDRALGGTRGLIGSRSSAAAIETITNTSTDKSPRDLAKTFHFSISLYAQEDPGELFRKNPRLILPVALQWCLFLPALGRPMDSFRTFKGHIDDLIQLIDE